MTILRDGTLADLVLVSDLALRSKAHWGYDPAFLEACRAELTFTPERLVRERVRVVASESSIFGVASLSFDEPDAELTALFVAPSEMGRGIGQRLFADALLAARQRGARRLIIEADPNAVAWYEARGAARIGEVPSGSIPGRMLPQLGLWV
jgi:GNAT superfamily N-acetyltransferase